MLNYRRGKGRYKVNELGSLYFDWTKYDQTKMPVIYIGGQMEHRLHILEQCGYSLDAGHNLFAGSWHYDYPIFNYDKSYVNAFNFADNLIKAIASAGLDEVVLITESHGGLIGAFATISPRIHKVIAIHPPILGTPLADKEMLKSNYFKFSLIHKGIYQIINLLINFNYGFEQDNKMGIYNPLLFKNVNLDKLIVVGSSVDITKENNYLVKELYDLIIKLTDKKSDGVVIFEPKELEKLGINYLVEDISLNHFKAGAKDNILNAYNRVLKQNNK